MKIILFTLGVVIVFLLSRLVLYRNDLNKMIKEVEYIKDKDLINRKLIGTGSNREIKKLRKVINELIIERQEMVKTYKNEQDKNKEIIASISHDLRTPLTSIKGYTDLLYGVVEDEKSKKYIEIIKSRSESLSKLIDTFYDLSKLDAKKENYKLEYVNISEILTETIASYYDRFTDKNIMPEIYIEENIEVLADDKAIERVFTNLIDNGIKYSHSKIKIFLGYEDGELVTKFINDNLDLDEEKIGKLFNKFFVVDTSRQSESTGLGLFITREIVESLGYNIKAELVDGNVVVSIKWK